jgi:phosphomannomutase
MLLTNCNPKYFTIYVGVDIESLNEELKATTLKGVHSTGTKLYNLPQNIINLIASPT